MNKDMTRTLGVLIVTGGIGPHYQPKLFKRFRDAETYAKQIDQHRIWPPFTPVIERRWACDVVGLVLI